MPEGIVAVVYVKGAHPEGSAAGPVPFHVVHGEIPVIEDVLRKKGLTVFSRSVGESVLEDIRSLAEHNPSLVINLCEDLGGDSSREMHFASGLELAGLPYTGSPPLALGLCRDKGRTKHLLRQHGIPTPDFISVRDPAFDAGSLTFPLMVKPALEDGSLGIDSNSVTGNEESLYRKVSSLLACYDEVLIEEYIDGRELNVAIIGPEPLRVLPVSEIDFSPLPPGVPHITCYEAKWSEGSPQFRGTAPVCPAPLDDEMKEKLSALSKAAFRALGMRDYGRIDWRLSQSRGPQFLEANPNPDISPGSGFMRSLRAGGLDYEDLVDALLESAARRRERADHPARCTGKGEGV